MVQVVATVIAVDGETLTAQPADSAIPLNVGTNTCRRKATNEHDEQISIDTHADSAWRCAVACARINPTREEQSPGCVHLVESICNAIFYVLKPAERVDTAVFGINGRRASKDQNCACTTKLLAENSPKFDEEC